MLARDLLVSGALDGVRDGLGVACDPHVRIPPDGLPPVVADPVDALGSPGSGPPDVAPTPHLVYAMSLDIGYDSIERQEVPVDVGHDGNLHQCRTLPGGPGP